MKVNFKTDSDTNSLFMIRGKDLSPEQKDTSKWKIDLEFCIPGPNKTVIKKSNLDLIFSPHYLSGSMPPDVTGRTRQLDAEDEWIGIEVSGSVDLDLTDSNSLTRLNSLSIAIKMGDQKKIKLSQKVEFDWAMEGRLLFY